MRTRLWVKGDVARATAECKARGIEIVNVIDDLAHVGWAIVDAEGSAGPVLAWYGENPTSPFPVGALLLWRALDVRDALPAREVKP